MNRVVVISGEDGVDAQSRGFLQRCFKGEIDGRAPCQWCGGLHQRECGRVKKMIFHPSGERVQEVEFWPDAEWDQSAVIWPEDVFK